MYKKVRLKHQFHQPKFNVTSRFLPSHMCSSCCLVGGLGRRCDIAISRMVLSGHLCWLRRNRYTSIQHVIHAIFWEVLIHSIGVHHPSPCQPKSKKPAGSFWRLTEEGLLRGLGFSYVLIHASPSSSHRKNDAELNLGTTMPYGKLVISCLLQFFELCWCNCHVWALHLCHVMQYIYIYICISYIHDLAMQGCRGTASSVYFKASGGKMMFWDCESSAASSAVENRTALFSGILLSSLTGPWLQTKNIYSLTGNLTTWVARL